MLLLEVPREVAAPLKAALIGRFVRRAQAWNRAVDIGIRFGELRVGEAARPRDVLLTGARNDSQVLNVVAMRLAALLTPAGEGTSVVTPRVAACVAER